MAPGTQVVGERGTLEVLRQLQGFEIPANAWERQVLARRIVDYDPKWLDQLCLTGAVGWGRLSPHPATLDYSNGSGERETSAAPRQRRVIPTSVAPITFFVREDADWMTPRHPGAEEFRENNGLSHGAQIVLDFLRQRGASFFADIVRGTEKLKAEIETALWELVAAGLVTADGFDNLRSLIDPKRRAGQGSGRAMRPRHNAGRWALLHAGRSCRAASRRGSGMLDAAAALWHCRPRCAGAGGELAAVARTAGAASAGWKIAARFAAAVLSMDSWANNSPCRLRWSQCGRCASSIPRQGERSTLSAADPLNLVGILVPGERVPAISGNSVTFRDGVAMAVAAIPASAGSEAVAS